MLSKNIEQKFSILLFEAPLNPPSLLVQNRVTVNLLKRYKQAMKAFTTVAHCRATLSKSEILSSSKPCV